MASLHQAQKIVAKDRHRFRVLNAGRGYGKTELAIQEIIGVTLAKSDRIVLFLGLTLKSTRDNVWDRLKKHLEPVIVKTNEQRLDIITRTQDRKGTSKIVLRGWESIQSLRGQEYDFIVMDEVAHMRNFWIGWEEVLRPTLRVSRGGVLFISTPQGYNHFFDLYNEDKKNNKDWKSFHFTAYDNPFIARAEIEAAKKDMASDRFTQEYMGSFQKAEGLVYPEFQRFDHMITTEPKNITETFLGIDFGYTNPTAILTIKKDLEGRFFVVDEWYKWGKTNAEVIEYCKSVKPNSLYPDPAEPDRIKEMRQHGLYVKEVSKDIASGIDNVRELFKSGRLFIHERCLNLIGELESYAYPEKRGERNADEKPIKENDHAMDALRYALISQGMAKMKIRKPHIPTHRVYRY